MKIHFRDVKYKREKKKKVEKNLKMSTVGRGIYKKKKTEKSNGK